MRLWRLTKSAFADLSGEGARQYGGRWNSPGLPMVYTAGDSSLALLEVRVHLDLPLDQVPKDYVLMEIETHGASLEEIGALPTNAAETSFGDAWLKERRSALLRVPSVIVPFATNVLVNPRHSDASLVKTIHIHPYRFDPRLWLSGKT